ncbi:hypothetical protein ACFX13_042875 [Malus domestica]
MAVAGKLSWRSIITDILAVLPVPQVLLVGVFFKMIGPGYLENRKASFLLPNFFQGFTEFTSPLLQPSTNWNMGQRSIQFFLLHPCKSCKFFFHCQFILVIKFLCFAYS